MLTLVQKVLTDLRSGQHREAYALFFIGTLLTLLGLFNVTDDRVFRSAVLLALSFIVFHTSVSASSQKAPLETILQSRDDYGPLSEALSGAYELLVYGPTAINVVVNAADVRRHIIDKGGTVRVIVLDDDARELSRTARQLDDSMDLASTLLSSVAALDRLREHGGLMYRRISLNPGFSLLIINPRERDARLYVEMHGFSDKNIADRMHIQIRRSESPRWFDYWLGRFEVMWEDSREPEHR